MGSSERFDYTAAGDAVNVAARLEALSKDFGVPIIVGGTTAEMTRDEIDYDELGEVQVRGKIGFETVFSITELDGDRSKA